MAQPTADEKAKDSPSIPQRRSARISAQAKEVEKEVVKAVKGTKRSRGAEDASKAKDATKKKKTAAPAAKSGEDTSKGALEATENEGLSPIGVGDSLPSFTLPNEKGEDVDVSTLASEKGIVMFLVPKADTPGCTKQACAFGDIYADITAAGYDVYCLSADAPAAQSKWQTKKNLPYSLLSDPKRILIKALGAGAGGKTARSHFIFGKGGKLLDKKIPVSPLNSPTLALQFIKGEKAT